MAGGAALLCVALGLASCDALAQTARKPFSVGGPEGAADGGALTQWILSWQASFKTQLTLAMKDARASGAAVWGLAALSFGYGMFHAAGPGHGKAVIASYMLANEKALQRGLVLSFLAAMLQGLVAIALVALARLVFDATAVQMNGASDVIEAASYTAIAALGAWLVWRKAGALVAALRAAPAHDLPLGSASRFAATAVNPDDPHVHDAHCGHFHAPDPATLGSGFSWGSAIATVFAAGSRPCSGAILVLVFALAQGIFYAGVIATLAMALGTALTTGALASLAVLAKALAARLTGAGSARAALVVRGLEALAALAVLALGLMLLAGTLYGARGG